MIIKSDTELKGFIESGKRLAEIRDTVVDAVAPGITSGELDDLTFDLCKKLGGKPTFLNFSPDSYTKPFPASSCISINEVVVHGIPRAPEITIKEGDLVMVDIGFTYEGFITDTARSVVAGEDIYGAQQIIDATEEALYGAIDRVQVGLDIQQISRYIESVAKKYGFGVPTELGGHGVGKKLHEEPQVPNADLGYGTGKFKENLVVAIEPIFTMGTKDIIFEDDGYTVTTKDKKWSAETEHTIVVRPEGALVLTQ